ncbi:MAG: penicillin-binding transpeptidase domain-containing protein, partial [Oscillibacter sp.]
GDINSYANCWLYNSTHGSHGSINITDAITVSCNYFFAEMGYRLGLDTLNKYAQAFGLGESTGIEIGDVSGRLAENRAGENQAPWAAFGQADYLFTPIQLSNYIATLVSGGKHCNAHLLKTVKSYDNTEVLAVGDSDPKNTVDISAATLTAVKEGMHNLTTKGSLAPYFQSCVVDAGAKTGTAQINKQTENTGVLVCFAPYDKPEIALAIVIEEGGSGSALASAAVKIINAYFSTDQIATVILGENQLLP